MYVYMHIVVRRKRLTKIKYMEKCRSVRIISNQEEHSSIDLTTVQNVSHYMQFIASTDSC